MSTWSFEVRFRFGCLVSLIIIGPVSWIPQRRFRGQAYSTTRMDKAIKDPVQLASVDKLLLLQLLLLLSCVVTVVQISCIYRGQITILHSLFFEYFFPWMATVCRRLGSWHWSMWLCMKWHDAWLYGLHTTCAETAAVSCGTSHASAVSTPLLWIFKTRDRKS